MSIVRVPVIPRHCDEMGRRVVSCRVVLMRCCDLLAKLDHSVSIIGESCALTDGKADLGGQCAWFLGK